MKSRAHNWSPDIRQIDLDVNRTYRDHIMFRQRYDVKYVPSVASGMYSNIGQHMLSAF